MNFSDISMTIDAFMGIDKYKIHFVNLDTCQSFIANSSIEHITNAFAKYGRSPFMKLLIEKKDKEKIFELLCEKIFIYDNPSLYCDKNIHEMCKRKFDEMFIKYDPINIVRTIYKNKIHKIHRRLL